MAVARRRIGRTAKAERWTLDKQAGFLEALAASCNVAKSCRAVGMSDAGVYRLRMKSPAFREAWGVALHEGYVRLELMMLERAIDGVEKPVFHGGKEVGRVREFDARLAQQLLQQHASAKAAPVASAAEDPAAIRARLDERFAAMEAALAGDHE